MPRKIPKRERPERYTGWPEDKRENYIRAFSLQERLRAHLKMAQELAVRNYRLKYDQNPRKTNPIRIAGRPDDHLRRYREEQWPEIREYLKEISEELYQIKRAYKAGRYPKWYDAVIMADGLAEQILDKMEMIQVQLIVTLRMNGQQGIKESNEAIINETAKVLILARDMREVLLSVPLDRAKIGLDEYGLEAIVDLSKQHYLDLTKLLWHRSQAKNKRG